MVQVTSWERYSRLTLVAQEPVINMFARNSEGKTEFERLPYRKGKLLGE